MAKKLWNAKFDPQIADAIESLVQSGLESAQSPPVAYVIGAFYERMEGLRKANADYTQYISETRAEIAKVKMLISDIGNGSNKTRRLASMQQKVSRLLLELSSYAELQFKLGKGMSQAGLDIIEACSHSKTRHSDGAPEAEAEAEPEGAMSWDPDAPQSAE